MSLLFMDGFNHYATADLAKKWDSVDPLHIITTGGRYGTNALSASSNSATQGSFKVVSPATPTEGIVGWCAYYTTLSAATAFGYYTEFSVLGSATTYLLTFVVNDVSNGNGTITVKQGSHLGTVLGTTSVPVWVVGEQHHIEIRWRLSTTAGEVEIRRDGVVVLLLTGINTGASGTSWNRVGWWPGAGELFSHLYVLDRGGSQLNYFLGSSAQIVTALPDGNGTQAWTPNTGTNAAAVDDATPNADTDYVYSRSAPQVDRYELTDLAAFDDVHAVQLNVTGRKVSSTVSPTLRAVTVIAAADHGGSTQAVPLPYTDLRQIWELNPATGAPWTIAEINAAQFGQERVA